MSKIVITVKLVADRHVTDDLIATLRVCNAAANQVAEVAWDRHIFRNYSLRSVTHGDVRSRFGLGAQAAQHTIRKVADAYNSGRPEHRRTRQRSFRWSSAQPFDVRNLSWDVPDGTVSIWTINGRARSVPFVCADWQAMLLEQCPIGESDLLYRKGALYLYATVDIPDSPMNAHPLGFLGVDLGIVNIATLSDGTKFSGSHRQPGPPSASTAPGEAPTEGNSLCQTPPGEDVGPGGPACQGREPPHLQDDRCRG